MDVGGVASGGMAINGNVGNDGCIGVWAFGGVIGVVIGGVDGPVGVGAGRGDGPGNSFGAGAVVGCGSARVGGGGGGVKCGVGGGNRVLVVAMAVIDAWLMGRASKSLM